jgi:hypothetical protein
MSKIVFGAGAALMAALMAGSASAQVLMGSAPYAPGPASTFSAQAHVSERLNSNGGSSSGMGALSQYITSSTSVGNINNVTVGDNSQAKVDSSQAASGDQDSASKMTTTGKTVNVGTPQMAQ